MPITPGRNPKYQDKLSQRLVVYVTPGQLEQLKEDAPHGDVSSFARERLLQSPAQTNPALVGTLQFRGPLLERISCGPWKEALESDASFELSAQSANFLELREGDAFMTADGQSMETSGILDGYLVAVRPLDDKIPRRGEIVVVKVDTGDGEAYLTLKHWQSAGNPGEAPHITDCQGNRITFPPGTLSVVPVARAVAVLGRL